MTQDRPPTITTLPDFLQLTDEQIATSERIQRQVAQAMHGRVQANREEARLIQGIHAERSARATLETLANEGRRKGRAEAANVQLGRLAEALADQGRFSEAAATHPDAKRAKELRKIQEAIERDDAEICDCKPEEVNDPVSNKKLRLPLENVVDEVFSPKHKRMMPLIRCNKCGDLNVKALTPELTRRQAAMMQTGDKPNDVALLK